MFTPVINEHPQEDGHRSRPGLSMFLCLSTIFLHFMIARPLNFPLTIAPLAVVAICLTLFSIRLNPIQFIGLQVLLTAPLVLHLPHIFSGGIDFDEYAKTFALWAFNVLAIYVSSQTALKSHTNAVANAAFISLAIVASFVFIQVTTASILYTPFLFNPFGEHQYLGEVDPSRFETASGFMRGPGFYLEPSFCAFVILTLYTICLIAGNSPVITLAFGTLGILSAQSMSGIVSLAIITLLARNQNDASSKASAFAWPFLLLGLFAVMYMLVGDYVVSRFLQIDSEGTSTYYRLVAPLIILKDVLQQSPFGIAFGQLEDFIEPYRLLNGVLIGNTIDNGAYLIVFYFGWLGLGALFYGLYRAARHLIARRRLQLLFSIYIFLGLQFSGGILLPEYAFLTILVIYQLRLTLSQRQDEQRA